MGILFGILIAWLIFSFILVEIGPLIGMMVVYLVRFILLCIWITISSIAKLIGLAITLPLRGIWFVLCLPFRLRRRVDPWDEDEAEFGQESEAEFDGGPQDEPEPEPEQTRTPFRTPYEVACWVLGLAPNSFDLAEFKKAYRSAIRKSHPDAGGDEEHAKIINRSAEIIRTAHGW